MDWQKVISSLLIIIIFIPLVFMGANVFFPKYDEGFDDYQKCGIAPRPVESPEEAKAWDEAQQKCWEETEKERKAWEENKRAYDGMKYIFTITVCLIALIAALVLPLNSSIKWGFIIGSAISAFFSTLIYLRTKSVIGFIILVIVFIFVVIFINKQKNKESKR